MGQPKHILVVDDDGDVRDVLVEILQNDNYRVSSVANGALMRDFLETDDAVDCVVLDALMPGETSISLALHLKEVSIPLVMISGSHDAMEYADLVTGPYQPDQLTDRKTVLGGRLPSCKPMASSFVAAWADRRSVLQTSTTGCRRAASSPIRSGKSVSGTLTAPGRWPGGAVNSSA